VRDSIRVEYREVVKEVRVEVPIPVEVKVAVIRPDTTSILSTSLAESTASLKDGWLHHTLENKARGPIVADISVKEVEKIVYRDREVVKETPYPVEVPLTKWQKIRMDFGGWTMGAFVLSIVFLLVKKRLF
jgi:hypothetical protein